MEIIVLSHGMFAEGIVNSAQMILGEQEKLTYFGLYPEEDIDAFKEKVSNFLNEKKGQDIVCFTDLLSGSPFNTLVSLIGSYEFEHLTGINLPLLLESLILRNIEETPKDLVKKIIVKAGESIVNVNELINEREEENLS